MLVGKPERNLVNCQLRKFAKLAFTKALKSEINTLYVVRGNEVTAKYIYSLEKGSLEKEDYYLNIGSDDEGKDVCSLDSLGLTKEPNLEASDEFEFGGVINCYAHFQLYSNGSEMAVVISLTSGSIVTLYQHLKFMNMSKILYNCLNFSGESVDSTDGEDNDVVTDIYVAREKTITAKFSYSAYDGSFRASEFYSQAMYDFDGPGWRTYESFGLKGNKHSKPLHKVVFKAFDNGWPCIVHFRLFKAGERTVVVVFLDGGYLRSLYQNLQAINMVTALRYCKRN